MSTVFSLVRRDLKLYFRDRALVFYSFLSVLIIIGLYALFLGNIMTEGIEQSANSSANVRFLVDSWIMSGLVLVNAVTVPLAVFDIMISDKVAGRQKDFMTSPVKRSRLVVAHLIAAWVIGIIMAILTILLAEIYIVANGGSLLSPEKMLEAMLAAALCVISYSAVFFFVAQFLQSNSAFSLLSTLVGTLIGFVGGIYIPIGELPQNVQSFMKVIPITHSAALLREIFVAAPFSKLFQGAPASASDKFMEQFGIQLSYGGKIMPESWLVLITLLTGIVFFLLSVIAVSHSGKKEA